MGAHTNPGGGASKKSNPVLGAASCHLTTEIGILTTLAMQSRGHFVVGSGRGGGVGGGGVFAKRGGCELERGRTRVRTRDAL